MDGAVQRASQAKRSRYDVRPRLLALCCRQDVGHVLACVEYGRNYLAAWCDRCELQCDAPVLEAAATDALLRVYWERDRRGNGRPTVAERTQALHVRTARYLMFRCVAEDAYRRRLAEALNRERLAPAEAYGGTGIRECLHAFPTPRRRAA